MDETFPIQCEWAPFTVGTGYPHQYLDAINFTKAVEIDPDQNAVGVRWKKHVINNWPVELQSTNR